MTNRWSPSDRRSHRASWWLGLALALTLGGGGIPPSQAGPRGLSRRPVREGRIREVEVRLQAVRRDAEGTIVVLRLRNRSAHRVRGSLDVRGRDAAGLDHESDTYSFGSLCAQTDFDASFDLPARATQRTCRKILTGTPRLTNLRIEVTGEGWSGTPVLSFSVPPAKGPSARPRRKRRAGAR